MLVSELRKIASSYNAQIEFLSTEKAVVRTIFAQELADEILALHDCVADVSSHTVTVWLGEDE